jgi:hypothetical protein
MNTTHNLKKVIVGALLSGRPLGLRCPHSRVHPVWSQPPRQAGHPQRQPGRQGARRGPGRRLRSTVWPVRRFAGGRVERALASLRNIHAHSRLALARPLGRYGGKIFLTLPSVLTCM